MITPTKNGTYPVICTELCGLGHAVMRPSAIVMPPAAFNGWRQAAAAARRSRPPGRPGKAVFDANGCAALPHAAGGRSDRERSAPTSISSPTTRRQAGKPLEDFIRESIVDPNAYVQPGFPKGVMPPFSTLPKDQLDSLVSVSS